MWSPLLHIKHANDSIYFRFNWLIEQQMKHQHESITNSVMNLLKQMKIEQERVLEMIYNVGMETENKLSYITKEVIKQQKLQNEDHDFKQQSFDSNKQNNDSDLQKQYTVSELLLLSTNRDLKDLQSEPPIANKKKNHKQNESQNSMNNDASMPTPVPSPNQAANASHSQSTGNNYNHRNAKTAHSKTRSSSHNKEYNNPSSIQPNFQYPHHQRPPHKHPLRPIHNIKPCKNPQSVTDSSLPVTVRSNLVIVNKGGIYIQEVGTLNQKCNISS